MGLRKNILITSICLIIMGIFLNVNIEYKSYLVKSKEMNDIKNFLEHKPNNDLYEYIAVLEIPNISLKKGITKDKTVDEDIQIINYNYIPNGNIVLAAHSGNCKICYFNDLDKININDIIYFYYNNVKYIYSVNGIEAKKKQTFSIENELNTITLITCKKNSDDLQIIVTGKLIRTEKF